ncbi:hypothetical protein KR059_011885, partial [Drosophila kikkawai]
CTTTTATTTTCTTTTATTTTCTTTTATTTTCTTTTCTPIQAETTTTCAQSPETTTTCAQSPETTTTCVEVTTACSGSSAAKAQVSSMKVRPARPIRPVKLTLFEAAQLAAQQPQELSIATYTKYVCRNKPNGFMLASLKSCSDYYVCRYGKPLQVSCGDKYFNALKGICDLPENTRCVQP